MKNFSDLSELAAIKDHPVSGQIDQVFKQVIKEGKMKKAAPAPAIEAAAELNERDLQLDAEGEFDLNFNDSEPLDFSDEQSPSEVLKSQNYGDIALEDEGENLNEFSLDEAASELTEDEDLSLSGMESLDFGTDNEELSLSLDDDDEFLLSDDEESGLGEDLLSEELSLREELPTDDFNLDNTFAGGLSFSGEESSEEKLSFDTEDGTELVAEEADLSDDAKEKLKEIDAIMDLDASQIHLTPKLDFEAKEDLDEPLVSPDLNLDSLDFSAEVKQEAQAREEKPKKKKKEVPAVQETNARDFGEDLREISGAYSGEMERMKATISNLRTDREELLLKIQKMEEEKVLQSRQSLSLRAELDEKKIELTIIRKKLNEEINELKDRLKFYDEKRLILEEKNRLLLQQLDKFAQRNKIDVKKVQMHERELEQKLELLKADAETQIRNRDLKILELKRKMDSMEFDMESISQQEKRSVESRFELEDKLEKAIKTLRTAITVLEDEPDHLNALNALKKNIEM